MLNRHRRPTTTVFPEATSRSRGRIPGARHGRKITAVGMFYILLAVIAFTFSGKSPDGLVAATALGVTGSLATLIGIVLYRESGKARP